MINLKKIILLQEFSELIQKRNVYSNEALSES